MVDKKILHLTLLRKWFEKIALGEKVEEYRDLKLYWMRRLENREYDEIWFRNGYSKQSPFMRAEFKGVERRGGRYVIFIGKILEIRNFKGC